MNGYPPDWTPTFLGALASYINGRAFGPKDWGAHGLPIIRIEQLLNSGAEADFYSGILDPANRIDSGDLVFSWSATLAVRRWDRGPAALNQHLFKVIPRAGVNDRFLHHLIEFHIEELASQSHGSTMRHIKRGDLADFEVCIPVEPEQARIAEVLDTLDEAIRGSDSVVAKLTTMKQAITHQLLTCGVDDSGRHRDRRSSPSSFKPAPYGLIPRSWEVQPAAALCEEIVVGIVVQPSKYYQEKGVPMLRSANVRTNRIDPSDLVFMSPADNQRMLKSQIRAGNVVTVRTGSPGGPGTSCVVPPEFDGANCIDIVISRLGPGVLPEYFSQWLNSDLGKGQVTKGQIGLAQQHFNVGELKKLLVYVPPITEQRRIVAALFEFEETIRLESERRSRLQELRSGLSSDLLTGHVRTIHS